MKLTLHLIILLAWAAFGSLRTAQAQCNSQYTGTGTGTTTTPGAAGLYGQYYPGTFHTQTGFNEANPVTFFSGLASSVQRLDATVNYADAGFGNVNGNGTGTPVNFSARYKGSVTLTTGAPYTFYLTSDDASYMFLGQEATVASPTPNNAFIKNGGNHGNVEVTNTIIVPNTGLYDVQILLGQGGGGVTIKLEYSGGPANLARQTVPSSALCAGPSNRVYGSLAPSANNVTNATLPGNGGTTKLNPNLSGFDLDGTVASYRITTLPALGTLKNGATVLAANALVPVASLGNLTYTTVNGQASTETFQYAAVDNGGNQGTAATYTIPVISNAADLGTTLASPATAAQGSLIFYTATVTNYGPVNATNVTTTINLPTGLTGVSLSNSGTYNAGTGVATFPTYDLAVNATASRNIAFSMTAGTVNATASSTAGGGLVDPNSNNNVGSAFTNPTQVADVSVAINGPSRVLTNQAVVYSVVPTNVGPSTATGIVLTAQLATGLVNVVASGPNGTGSYVPGTGVVTWPLISSLTNGASLVHTVRFNSPATSGGTISASASATSNTANGDPVAGNNDGTADQSKITTSVVDLAATLLCVIPGQNGDVNLTSNFNTYFPGSGSAGVGTGNPSSVVLGTANAAGATTPIVAGDLVLIMQMQGVDINATDTDAYGDGLAGNNDASGIINTAGANAASFTAGVYEYAIAGTGTNITTAGGTLNLTQALGYTYSTAAATAATGQRRFQVIRVPRYANATLPAPASGAVTGPAWNGSTGGVMALDVNGVLNFNGNTLSMAGKGFRGGAGQQLGGDGSIPNGAYRHSTAQNTSANKGEGIAGTSRYLNNNGVLLDNGADGYPNGDRGRGAPGNAGGGGTDGRPGQNDQNSGGGGGSNAGRGGVGGNGWDSNSPTGGYGGAGFTQATASRIIMGGGGGAGTTNNGTGTPSAGFASSGATGGGVIIIRATNVSTNAGTIDVSGNTMPYVPANDASGGGGAGGSLVMLVNASANNAAVLQNITLLAKGGDGGSNTGGGSPHGPGGGGAGGVSFTSSATSSSSSLVSGANGSTIGFLTYGSGVGSASLGQGLNNITRANVPNIVVGCPADVQTTVVNSTGGSNAAAPGSTVTFTVTTLNNGTSGTANNVQPSLLIAPNLPFITVNGSVGTPIGSTASFSYPDGSVYNSNTGIVTFPAVNTLATGAQVVNTVSFAMPVQTVRGQATSTSGFDLDPRLANNDGTLPQANTFVAAINSIAGRVFDDVNYGGGTGRNYITANTAAVATGFPDGKIGSPNTRVELYTYGTNGTDGTFVAATTTGPDGVYGFSSVATNADYTVRVVNATVKSIRNPAATTAVPVQTFRRTTSGTLPTGTTSSVVSDDVNRVGGENPALADGSSSAVQLTFVGLNPNGGDNTAFMDAVEIVNVSTGTVVATALGNASFETPAITAANQTGPGYYYNPIGGTWTFNGTSGLVANNGAFNNADAPDGLQAGYLQSFGIISQPLTLPAGTYFVRFKATQRPGGSQQSFQTIGVQINGTQVGSPIQPTATTYGSYQTSQNFTVGASNSGVGAQSIASVHLGAALVADVDFGFNFDLVVNKNGAGQGSLRQFLTNANVLPNANLDQAASSNGGNDPAAGIETSIFMIPDGSSHQGMRAGTTDQLTAVGSGGTAGKAAIIDPGTAANGALPALTDANTTIDGTTQGLNVTNSNNVTLGAGGTSGSATKVGTTGTTLPQLNSPEVQLVGTPGAANSDYGVTLSATNLTVQGLAIYGFGNTGAAGTGNANGANVYVTGGATTGILIQNNVIGTSANAFPTDGTDPLSTATRSTGHGILLANLNSGISATASILNNLIGFNGLSGIEDLANATTNSVLIQGNEIRRNGALNTSAAGVHFGTAGGTLQANLVTGNRGTGVDFGGTAGAVLVAGNTVSGNGGGGTFSGVRAFGQGNTVSGNVISGNTGDGVLVLAGTNAANVAGSTVISQNAISANALLGIDLLAAGNSETAGTVTINDLNDVDGGKNGTSALGGNGLLNFPVIVQARIQGTNLLVTGYARPGVKLEFFSVGGPSTAPTPDASGFGEGPVYLSTATEGSGTDTNGGSGAYSGLINGLNQGADNTNLFTFSIPLSSFPAGVTLATGNVIVVTATLSTVGTSEFSGKVTVGSGPLPVELSVFTATAKSMDAHLVWRTASEKNNDHFDVERSLNGTDYVKIAQLKGQGSTSSATDYALTDAGIGAKASGPVYYRLKQVDTDGTATYSPVRTVTFGGLTPAISLAPNPATAKTQLDLTQLPTGSYQVSVFDAVGRVVLRTTLEAGLAHALNLNTIASGTYTVLVRGQNNGQTINLTKRLIKE